MNPFRSFPSKTPVNNPESNQEEINRKQNAEIQRWTPLVKASLKSSARWFSDGKFMSSVLRHRGNQIEKKLAASIGSKIGKQFGLANYIGFQFERHGVFVHKGVGRGYKAAGKGFVFRTAKNTPEKRERIAVEWFNPILAAKVPILADRIAEINADAAVNATKMKIR